MPEREAGRIARGCGLSRSRKVTAPTSSQEGRQSAEVNTDRWRVGCTGVAPYDGQSVWTSLLTASVTLSLIRARGPMILQQPPRLSVAGGRDQEV